MRKGSLTVVGTGIQLVRHTTPEAREEIEDAQKVFVIAEPATEMWIKRLNPTAESLISSYLRNKPRITAYRDMVKRILAPVREGLGVCAAFYGHPGVFVYPSHEAIRIARSEGFKARMLPGISAEDCLFADLGVDPGKSGCQSFEATNFLVYRRKFDPSSSLILWQISTISDLKYRRVRPNRKGLRVLADYLKEFYDPNYLVVVYEASPYVICDAIIQPVRLELLPDATITPFSTLYVPPKPAVPDREMLKRLGIAHIYGYPRGGTNEELWRLGRV